MLLTLNNLYNVDPSIFNGFSGPQTDKVSDFFKYEVLRRYGHFKTLYSEPGEFKLDFNSFCNSHSVIWDKLASTLNYDYNPLYNYDRTEEVVETREGQRKGEQSSKRSGDATESVRHVLNSDSDGTLHTADTDKVSAYNDDAFHNKEQRTGEHTSRTITKSNDERNGGYTENGSDNTTANEISDETCTRKFRAYGNIGVTTTQEMIEAERELLKFSLLDHICYEFKTEFLILAY